MEKDDIINLLKRLDLLFYNYSNEVENQKDRYNESYYNGYQACCDDIHGVIQETIQEISE